MKTKIELNSKDASCRRLGVYHRHHMEWPGCPYSHRLCGVVRRHLPYHRDDWSCALSGHSLDLFASAYRPSKPDRRLRAQAGDGLGTESQVSSRLRLPSLPWWGRST